VQPELAHEALSTRLEVGVLLPCSVVVYEGDDGRATVMAIDPSRTAAAADPRLAELEGDVGARLARVLGGLA
jgi:uncharacterized protein (DUF302 family)